MKNDYMRFRDLEMLRAALNAGDGETEGVAEKTGLKPYYIEAFKQGDVPYEELTVGEANALSAYYHRYYRPLEVSSIWLGESYKEGTSAGPILVLVGRDNSDKGFIKLDTEKYGTPLDPAAVKMDYIHLLGEPLFLLREQKTAKSLWEMNMDDYELKTNLLLYPESKEIAFQIAYEELTYHTKAIVEELLHKNRDVFSEATRNTLKAGVSALELAAEKIKEEAKASNISLTLEEDDRPENSSPLFYLQMDED